MKSIYYAAVVTRAYRKMLDSLDGKKIDTLEGYREELFKVSHREFHTGFFFDRDEIQKPTDRAYIQEYSFLGSVEGKTDEGLYQLDVKNQIKTTDHIEFIGPDMLYEPALPFRLFDKDMTETEKTDHGKITYLKTQQKLEKGWILRKKA
jgi:putative protease